MMKVHFTRPSIIEHNTALELSRRLITHPDSTFLISLKGRRSEWGVIVVDREAQPHEGAMLLHGTPRGFKLSRWREGDPLDTLWGVVTWVVKRP